MIDLEIELVKGFGWSLYDIDQTDIHSLIPFLVRAMSRKENSSAPKKRKVYIDQVNL